MRILITGGTGFVGRHLIDALLERGEEIWVYTHADKSRACGLLPEKVTTVGRGDPFPRVDALVNLAGESIAAKILTRSRMKTLLKSRLDVLHLLDEKYPGDDFPGIFIQASATGFYASGQICDEAGECGGVFGTLLSELEDAASALCRKHDSSCCLLRIGVVMGDGGGLMDITSRLPRLKIVMGGDNLVPWIGIDDLTRALCLLLKQPQDGAVNAVSPAYKSANELLAMGKMGAFFIPLPSPLLRLFDRRGALLLASHQVIPTRLMQLGFEFQNGL